jgi:hypothetical protein
VGTGLLGVMAIGFPLAALVAVASGDGLVIDSADALVEPWVYGVVYTGFAVQGVALLTGFWLYAWDRWPSALRGRVGVPSVVPALRAVLDPLTTGAVLAAVALAGLYLAWGFGATAGLAPAHVAARHATAHVTDLVGGAFILAAVVGLLLLARGWAPSSPLSVATLLAWSGSAAMFAWGMWTTVLRVLGGAGLVDGFEVDVSGLVGVIGFALGMVMGIAPCSPMPSAAW